MRSKTFVIILAVAFSWALVWVFMNTAGAQNTSQKENPPQTSEQQYQRMLDEQSAILKRSALLLTQQEDFIKRQEGAFKRYERILDIWEKQQQYQKYLDSLSKK
jgi:hypothetical protein